MKIKVKYRENARDVEYFGKVVSFGDVAHREWPHSPWEALEVAWDGESTDGNNSLGRVGLWEALPINDPSGKYGRAIARNPAPALPAGFGDYLCNKIDAIMLEPLPQSPVDAEPSTAIDEGAEAEVDMYKFSPFEFEVDSEIFPDYYAVVPVPIYVDLLRQRLKNGYYRQTEALSYDIDQIYNNCAHYNVEGTAIVQTAHELVIKLHDAVSAALKLVVPDTNDPAAFGDEPGAPRVLKLTIASSSSSSSTGDGKNLRLRLGKRVAINEEDEADEEDATPVKRLRHSTNRNGSRGSSALIDGAAKEDQEPNDQGCEHDEASLQRPSLSLHLRRSNSSKNSGVPPKSRRLLSSQVNPEEGEGMDGSAQESQESDNSSDDASFSEEEDGNSNSDSDDSDDEDLVDDSDSDSDSGGSYRSGGRDSKRSSRRTSQKNSTKSRSSRSRSNHRAAVSAKAPNGKPVSRGRNGSSSLQRSTRSRRAAAAKAISYQDVSDSAVEEDEESENEDGDEDDKERAPRQSSSSRASIGSQRATRTAPLATQSVSLRGAEPNKSRRGRRIVDDDDDDEQEEAGVVSDEVNVGSARSRPHVPSQPTFPVRLDPDTKRQILKLLAAVEEADSDGFFAEPVDDDIAPGYSSIIEEPMDLSTIRKKFESRRYSSLDEVVRDLMLMFDNCEAYNEPKSTIVREANALRRLVLRFKP